MLLLEALAQEENGQFYKAINILVKKEKQITNQIQRLEACARVYKKLNKPEKAVESYE
jgi:hypothetical protein